MTFNLAPISRRSALVIQQLDKELLIYDLNINKAFSLNQTSAEIWQLCDGNRTISEIASCMSVKFSSPITEEFVWLALEQFRKDNLLENASDIIAPFNGLSRRAAIRKAGFASLVALPIIATLIAPQTAQAASANCTATTNRPNGCVCNANGNCQSGCCGTNGVMNSCVAAARDAQGAACRVGCECFSSCCVGGVCQNGEIPTGTGTCTTACQCASNSCNTATGICN